LSPQQHKEVTPDVYVKVLLSDPGTGMDSDFITQAFESFFTTKKIGEGNGLGLSMVYSFIKQSNDHVVTINKLDRGT